MEITDIKSLSAFYKASAAIKKDFTEKRLTTLIKSFDYVYWEDLILDREKARDVISGLPLEFYDEIALSIEDHINNSTEFWMMHDTRMDIFVSEEISSYIINKIFENAPGSDSEYLYKGVMALEDDSYDLAMLYFNHFDHYLGNYYKGICYMELKSYSNAIKNFNLFLKGLNNYFATTKIPKEEFDPSHNPSLMIYRWEVYKSLAYLYIETQHYNLAIKSCNEALKIHTLETIYNFCEPASEDSIVLTEFDAFVNNYVLALMKTAAYKTAAKFLESVLHLIPENTFYQKQLGHIKARIERHKIADDILRNIAPVKRPFNIDAFKKTQSLARERILEDMILQQIKYGFMVFGRNLEVYQDERIDGRQYFIKEANGILDLLLIDKAADTLYVVELKRGLAGIEVISQVENYMVGLSKEIDKPIKGIICLHQANPALTKLVKSKEDIELFTYHFDFKKLG